MLEATRALYATCGSRCPAYHGMATQPTGPCLSERQSTVRVKYQLGGRLKPLTHPDEE